MEIKCFYQEFCFGMNNKKNLQPLPKNYELIQKTINEIDQEAC